MRCSPSSINAVKRKQRASPSPLGRIPVTSTAPLQTAVDDPGGTLRTVPVAIVTSDHQNKAEADLGRVCDVGSADAILKMIASFVEVAALAMAKEKYASLLGETRNGDSGERIPGRPIVSNSFHPGQSGDH
jgi:hypothetical protein